MIIVVVEGAHSLGVFGLRFGFGEENNTAKNTPPRAPRHDTRLGLALSCLSLCLSVSLNVTLNRCYVVSLSPLVLSRYAQEDFLRLMRKKEPAPGTDEWLEEMSEEEDDY